MNDRVKELDSVRGIAVIAVIALHTFSRADQLTKNYVIEFAARLAGAGWVGVDMFFTLSGYLITSILLRTKEKNDYYKNFYMRRVLRILPLYVTLIAVVYILAPYLDPEFRRDFPRALPVLLLFQQNWTAIGLDIPITGYLWVTWSLAVEEQFYFFLPLLVQSLNKKTFLKFSITYIIFSFISRIVGVVFFADIKDPAIYQIFYFNTFTRFEGFLFGALLAVLMTFPEAQDKVRKYALPVFLVFFGVFLTLFLSAPEASHPNSGYRPVTMFAYTSAALCTAGLIAVVVTHPETSVLRRLLQNRVFIFFGKYSYSMYLFHAIFAVKYFQMFLQNGQRGAQAAALYLLLVWISTILTALLTWNLIESPMLGLKRYFEYR